MRTNNGAKGHTNKHAVGANQGGEASGQMTKAIQPPTAGGIGAKTKKPGSLKKASSREPAYPRLRTAMV